MLLEKKPSVNHNRLYLLKRKEFGVAATANVAKELLADTVEYDITGTKTNYTLQKESP